MALKLYDTLNPSGDFPLVEAKDVKMPDGTRLSELSIEPGIDEETEERIAALEQQDQAFTQAANQLGGQLQTLNGKVSTLEETAETAMGSMLAMGLRLTALETPATSVDMTEFGTGKIKETKADGSVVTYTFVFDDDGNPIRINDSNGNSTGLVGFGQMSYKSAEGVSF